MSLFLEVVDKIKETLLQDEFVNRVTYGDIYQIDLNKDGVYPVSHFIIDTVQTTNNTKVFTISLFCMDILDITKEEVSQELIDDNEKFIWNTQLEVINRFYKLASDGELFEEQYQITELTCDAFTDRFDNKLAGWLATFDLTTPNTMTIC